MNKIVAAQGTDRFLLTMAAFLTSSAIMALTHGQWIEHTDPALTRQDYMMAIGYYKQSIYLLYVCSDCIYVLMTKLLL